jgi:hypothetical protein
MTWVKITKTDFTTSSAVNIDNCFSATYRHYLVVRNLLGSVGDQSLNVRLRVGGADDSGTNYRYQRVYVITTSVAADRATGVAQMSEALGKTETAAFGYGMLRISNPFEAVRTTAWTDSSTDADGGPILSRLVHAHDLTTSYTGLTVIPLSGTITGSITVYGLKES